MHNLSFYGSHNAAVVLEKDGEILEVIEIERLLNLKNQGLAQYLTARNREFIVNSIKNYFGVEKYDTVLFQNTDTNHNNKLYHYQKYFPANNYIECKHHESHAAGSFYQSNHTKALILSYDGGGNDGFFNIYLADRKKGVELIDSVDVNLGVGYSMFGNICKQIKKEYYEIQGNLTYSGKLMGLAGYGKVRSEWFRDFIDWYSLPVKDVYKDNFFKMIKSLGIQLDDKKEASEEDSKDIAATSQYAFETVVYDILKPYLDKFNYPLHITGGSGLNVLLNTKLSEYREVFVSPNPSDCGLAVGMMLNYLKPEKAIDITYSGIEVLDKLTLPSIVESRNSLKYTPEQMAEYLKQGQIIGVVRGKSEHGPRALGNRSILCDPSIPEMKDTLNSKVKHREFYRPFAPVVRLEDVNKYFEWDKESRWMSFCPKVKVDNLPSITHVDNTARVQTVTKEQNAFLYELLGHIPVLLNTSFNVQGKPLVSTYSQALQVLDNTQMDKILLEDYFIW